VRLQAPQVLDVDGVDGDAMALGLAVDKLFDRLEVRGGQ
jgi:hypothetical protein